MTVYTNKEERERFGILLTKALKKQYPFILDIEIEQAYIQGNKFELDCLIVVTRDFIIENVKLNCSNNLTSPGIMMDSMNRGLLATYIFNDCSKKGLKFKTEEFLKLSMLLFYSLYGKNAEWYTYSVMFKMI